MFCYKTQNICNDYSCRTGLIFWLVMSSFLSSISESGNANFLFTLTYFIYHYCCFFCPEGGCVLFLCERELKRLC